MALDWCLPISPPCCVHCFPPSFLCGYLKLLLWKHKHQKTNLQSTDSALVLSAALWRSLQKLSALFSTTISHFWVSVSEFLPRQQKIFYFPHTQNQCFTFPTLPYLKTITIFMFLNLPGSWCRKNSQSRKIPACKGCLVLIILPKKSKDLFNGNTKWTTLAVR